MTKKTNPMRILEREKIKYNHYDYSHTEAISGVDVAETLGEDPRQVAKTLVTKGKSGEYYVFLIPVKEELDLKKAAEQAEEKSISLIALKELLPLTGYIHGGCSPIGMKKIFPTIVDKSFDDFKQIIFSGGKIGHQIEMEREDLGKVIRVKTADIIKQKNRV